MIEVMFKKKKEDLTQQAEKLKQQLAKFKEDKVSAMLKEKRSEME